MYAAYSKRAMYTNLHDKGEVHVDEMVQQRRGKGHSLQVPRPPLQPRVEHGAAADALPVVQRLIGAVELPISRLPQCAEHRRLEQCENI